MIFSFIQILLCLSLYISYCSQQSKDNMKRFDKPYVHYSYPNFLDDASFKKLSEAYDHFQFFEKESDLFHFFQTNELESDPSIAFLKNKLNGVFGQLCDMKDTSYNIFASMYFKGDYLLCHDDVVDDRKYAFILYLQDHPSSDLILYDETATKEAKRIKVKKNHLVLFEVSNVSYHEVAMAKHNNRRSITGWLSKKGEGALKPKKEIPPYQPSIPKNLIKFNFNQFLTDEEYFSVPNMEYIFDVVSRKPAGPFYQRKATKLELSQCVVLDMKGYTLFSADFLQFKVGDYLLLNDPVNNLGENILDVFILQLPNGDTDIEKFFINIIDQEGRVEGGVPYANDTMFLIQRGKKNYYIDVCEEEVLVAHLIYKSNKGKKSKAQPLSQGDIKSKRAKLLKNNMDDIKKMDEEEEKQKKKTAKKNKKIKKASKTTKQTHEKGDDNKVKKVKKSEKLVKATKAPKKKSQEKVKKGKK